MLKILYVEDNAGDVMLMQYALKTLKADFSLRVFGDGGEAMAFFNKPDKDLPELILLDLNLPRFSGWELLASIKLQPILNNAAVTMLSTSDSPTEIARAKKEGVPYFRKPLDVDGYLQTVNDILNQTKLNYQTQGTSG
jgi:chemotaxis family two-component system response regulator Rcp1